MFPSFDHIFNSIIFSTKLQQRNKNVTSGKNETRNCSLLEFLTLHYTRFDNLVFSDVTFIDNILILSYLSRFGQSASYLRIIPQPASSTKHFVRTFIWVYAVFNFRLINIKSRSCLSISLPPSLLPTIARVLRHYEYVQTNTAKLSTRYHATVPANATNSHYISSRLTGNLSHRCKSLLAHWLQTNNETHPEPSRC